MTSSHYDETFSRKSHITRLATFVLITALFACNSDNGSEAGQTSRHLSDNSEDEAAARCRETVNKRVSASVVSSFAREWDVPESKVECLLADLDVTQLDDAASDSAVANVFAKYVVDPAVVE